MKQIVFLISAFLMLVQIHSTVTAVPIDTSTGESVGKSFSKVDKTESASNDVEGDKKAIGDAGAVHDEPRSSWDDIREILLQLTDLVENLMITFKGEIENAWKKENVKPTANWETRTNEIKKRVHEIEEEVVVFIEKLEDQAPIAWANIEEAINELLQNLIEVIEKSREVVVKNASSTEEERAEIVDKEFQDIMETINESWAKAQEIIIDETMKASN